MPGQIVDTHIHVWNFNKAEYSWLKGNTSILNRTYQIEELEEERKKVGITEGVLVQAANNLDDTNYMLEVAGSTDWIKGVVGWLPLMNPSDTEKTLREKYGRNKLFKGIRHLIHDEADLKWLLQEQVIESLRIVAAHHLPFDLVGVLPAHIEAALTVAGKIPSLKMVFDHLNQPPIDTKEKYGRWGELMQDAAGYGNFYAKVSGLGTTSRKSSWSEEDVRPYVEFVFEHFGSERCFCGGDWPVSLIAGSYSRTWNVYKKVIDSLLDAEQRDKVYHGNAVAFYQL